MGLTRTGGVGGEGGKAEERGLKVEHTKAHLDSSGTK